MSRAMAMSLEQRNEMWRGWQAGLTHRAIAEKIGISGPSVFLHIEKYGGIRPAPKIRRASSLSTEEREEIYRGIASGLSLRNMANHLGRNVSTVSREIARNGGIKHYRAARADAAAWKRAERPKPCKLALNGRLRHRVALKLAQACSPEQISGWLYKSFPDEDSMHVSHETIYKTLYIQSRGQLNKDLRDKLRTARRFRQARTKSTKGQARGQIVDAVSISERPPEVEDRAVPGHWEGDLIAGDQSSFIATLVERKTRFVILCKIENKETETVVQALIRQMGKLPEILKETLTWDRGSELQRHKEFTIATDIQVYFCDPYSPWQRGSNENTNGLLRQYFPMGESVADVTQAELNAVARKLNTRPRKTLGFSTPKEELVKVLH